MGAKGGAGIIADFHRIATFFFQAGGGRGESQDLHFSTTEAKAFILLAFGGTWGVRI